MSVGDPARFLSFRYLVAMARAQMLQEQFGELPRALATSLVRKKLKLLGCAGNDALVGTLLQKNCHP